MSGVIEAAPPAAAAQDGIISSFPDKIPTFDGESEEALALRHTRKPRHKHNLTLEFTRDPALLHQYFCIYHSQCRVVDIPQFQKAEEDYNKRSHIMVVRREKLVVGGARITVCSPRQPYALPLEIDNFKLGNVFPDLNTKQMKYAEFSRLSLLPDFRGTDVLRDIIINVHRKCVALDVDYVYAAAPLLNGRTYRQICKSIGLSNAFVYTDIDIPPAPGFEEVKDYLFGCVIDKSLEKYNKLSTTSENVIHEYM